MPTARENGGAGRPPFAVADVGSNSVRLVVYEHLARAPLPLFNEKAMCGLGRGLAATGRLNAEGVECALRALRRFAHIAEAMGAETLDVVATEAVRRAANGPEFLEAARAACGTEVHVLSGTEEARTAAAGVAFGFFEPDGVSGDLGGGSVDLARVGPDGPSPPYGSLPLGTLPVGEALARDGRAAAERLVEERLASLPWLEGAARGRAFYVVGGGWRALGRVSIAAADVPLKVVHDYALSAGEAARLGRRLARLSQAELASLPGMPRRRTETLQAAALVFEKVVQRLAPERVVFSAFGLREGRLFGHLGPEELARDPLIAGAELFGRSRARVPEIGDAVARWTVPLFLSEDAQARRLRLAACALSDTGWRGHPDGRALEAFFRIVQYPFVGLSHAERAFLAYAIHARYRGEPDDPFVRPALTLLAEPARRRAELLGAGLQLAYRISGGVPDLLDGSRLELLGDEGGSGGEVVLHLAHAELAPDDDMLRTRLRTLARAAGVERFRVVGA